MPNAKIQSSKFNNQFRDLDIWHLNFDILNFLKVLTLSGGFYLKSGNKLFQFLPTTFRAFSLPGIVFSDAEDEGKFLATFRASVVVAGHPLSLLSFINLIRFV